MTSLKVSLSSSKSSHRRQSLLLATDLLHDRSHSDEDRWILLVDEIRRPLVIKDLSVLRVDIRVVIRPAIVRSMVKVLILLALPSDTSHCLLIQLLAVRLHTIRIILLLTLLRGGGENVGVTSIENGHGRAAEELTAGRTELNL